MLGKYKKIRDSGLKLLSAKDLSLVLGLDLPSARVAATRLFQKGVLRRLRKDLYMLSELPLDSFDIANRLLGPSYISFESALNFWGITTQIPFPITSASMRSKRYTIEQVEFVYCQLPEKLFNFGYQQEKNFYIATPEKALLDTLYYSVLGRKSAPWDEWKLNKINRTLLKKYSAFYPLAIRRMLNTIFP